MKKKISVFALLLSLMLSFVIPVPAAAATETTADDVKYSNVEEFMHDNGYLSFTKNDNAVYLVFIKDTTLYVAEILGVVDSLPVAYSLPTLDSYNGDSLYILARIKYSSVYVYKFYSPEQASLTNDYNLKDTKSVTQYNEFNYMGNIIKCAVLYIAGKPCTFENLVYSDLDVFTRADLSNTAYIYGEDELIFESMLYDGYSFVSWCKDAGLNCVASSNESPNKIPYSYNSYWHIVRKTSNGKWLLTTIGNSVMQENIADYRLLVGENGNLHVASIYSGDDVNGYKLNVRQYEYDTDGWKVRTYETLDTRDSSGLVDLGAGSGFDDTRVLAYTSESIYDHNGSVPLYEKSTEYFDVTNTPDTPDTPDEPDNPTPTPTTAPGSSGSGRPGSGTRPDTGGQATGGGGLDFIINLFTMIWTKICSVPMAVDGYSINLQQIVIYGALVSIVGGFIMHFIFGRK